MRTALVLATCLMAASCYRDTAPVAPPPVQPVPRHVPAVSRDVLAYLPAEASFVMTVDFARLRDSVLWSHATELIASKLGAARPGSEACMDLMKRVSHVGLATLDTVPSTIVLAVHGLDRDRAIDCIKHSSSTPVTEDRGVYTLYAADRVAMLAFPDAATAVMYAGLDARRDQLDALLAKGSPLRQDQDFLDIYAQRDPDVALWFDVPKQSRTLANMPLGVKLVALHGGLAATDSVTAYLHFQTTTPEEATGLQQQLDQNMQGVRTMFDRADVTADVDVVTITLAATEEQLARLAPIFGAIF